MGDLGQGGGRRCQWMMLSVGRICDGNAVGVYHGIGGQQNVCALHAEALRREWGIRVRPLARSDNHTPSRGRSAT